MSYQRGGWSGRPVTSPVDVCVPSRHCLPAESTGPSSPRSRRCGTSTTPRRLSHRGQPSPAGSPPVWCMRRGRRPSPSAMIGWPLPVSVSPSSSPTGTLSRPARAACESRMTRDCTTALREPGGAIPPALYPIGRRWQGRVARNGWASEALRRRTTQPPTLLVALRAALEVMGRVRSSHDRPTLARSK